MARVLFPGRFQPFHKGHLHALKRLFKEFDEVVVAIGSAQEGFTCNNPFTAGERIEMIYRALTNEGYGRDRYWLIPVPDINKPLAWTTYLLSMVPKVDAVASGNPHIIYLYGWLGFKIIEIDLIEPSRFSGRAVRKTMACGGDWKELVPREVAVYIDEINGVERVRRVCGYEGCRD